MITNIIIVAVVIAAVVLIGWNFINQSSFYSDCAFAGSFGGNRYECMLGGLNQETRVLCLMGADESGVYILSHPKPGRPFWGYGTAVFKGSLFIPWQDIECTPGDTFPFKDSIWFKLASRRIYLYLAKEIGEKLLADARRKIRNRMQDQADFRQRRRMDRSRPTRRRQDPGLHRSAADRRRIHPWS